MEKLEQRLMMNADLDINCDGKISPTDVYIIFDEIGKYSPTDALKVINHINAQDHSILNINFLPAEEKTQIINNIDAIFSEYEGDINIDFKYPSPYGTLDIEYKTEVFRDYKSDDWFHWNGLKSDNIKEVLINELDYFFGECDNFLGLCEETYDRKS